MKPILALLALLALLVPVPATHATSFADPAFEAVWSRTDAAVAAGRSQRSWLWGPQPNSAGRSESYAQSPAGQRLVQYFDKARMEINSPNANRSELWYVTNGLLPIELITGQMQTGDAQFEQRAPANIPAVGDPGNTFPTYADLARVYRLVSADQRVGRPAADLFSPDGTISGYDAYRNDPATMIALVEEQHGIPAAFLTFMNEQSQSLGRLFVFGRPVSAAYWVKASVAGVERAVLVQVFERRVLTYTPDNPAAFRVESGNVGQHYEQWRYGYAITPATLFPADFSQARAAYHRSGPIPQGGAGNVFVDSADLGTTLSSPAVDTAARVAVFGTNSQGVVALDIAADLRKTTMRWRYDPYRSASTGYAFSGSVLLYNGVAYIGDTSGAVHAINVADGSARWVSTAAVGSSDITTTYIYGAPITDGTNLYFVTARYYGVRPLGGQLYAVRLADGAQVWVSDWVAQSFAGAIFGFDGNIYISPLADKLYGYSRDGRQVSAWDVPGSGLGGFTPAFSNGLLYLATTDGALLAYDRSGTIVSRADVSDVSYTTPAVAGGRVYIGTRSGRLLGLSATNLQDVQLSLPVGAGVSSSIAAVDGYLYFSAGRSFYRVKASDPRSLTALWTIEGEDSIFGAVAPVVAQGRIYTGSSSGTRYIIQ